MKKTYIYTHTHMATYALLFIVGVLLATTAHAAKEKGHAHHAGAHVHEIYEPIDVMGAHLHPKGEGMLSYRYARMDMSGNKWGIDSISTADVLNDFMVAPLDMTMNMHMIGGMYGVQENLTLTAMLPYVEKSMNHQNRMGVRFKTKSSGVGDAKIGGIYKLHEDASQQVLLNFGVSLPTGSTDKKDDTPVGANQKLPYPMQLGSGTLDPMLGITYLDGHASWAWGAQASTVLRFGENDEGYRLGNEYNATAWIARAVHKSLTASFRLDGKVWGDVHGQDSDLNPNMVPTARTDLRGGRRIDALIGVDFAPKALKDKGHNLGLSFGMPVYENLDGPQLETEYRLTLGWQYRF